MLLVGVREENGWLTSRWNLTYKVGWEHICKAVNSIYGYYAKPEVLVNGGVVEVSDAKDILEIDESGAMVIRGISQIFKLPLMITFYNQLQAVDVNIAAAVEEFNEADYEKFNKSMCQFMDSIELAVYR